MKLNPGNWRFRDEGDLIAGFGEANLFKYLNGKVRTPPRHRCRPRRSEAVVFAIYA